MKQEEYARQLSLLDGIPFQDEVCTLLRSCYADFQRVIAKPSGDGGLDGTSHHQRRAYCMYGPVFDPKRRKLMPKKLEDDIVGKFKDDMRKLFELQGRTSELSHKPNSQIGTILGTGTKIEHITLIVNNFESHQILGPLNTARSTYCNASRCTYVEKNASIVVWGPKDLAELIDIDEHTIFRAEQRKLEARIQKAMETAKKPQQSSIEKQDFDRKFDWLVANNKMTATTSKRIADPLLSAWAKSIKFDRELANLSPQLHRKLEEARERSVLDAALETGDAIEQIRSLRNSTKRHLEESLSEHFTPGLLGQTADGETARLIGVCPLDWRE